TTSAREPPIGLKIHQALSFAASTGRERYVDPKDVKNEAFRLLHSLAPRIHFGILKNFRPINPFKVLRVRGTDASGTRVTKYTTRIGALFGLLQQYFGTLTQGPVNLPYSYQPNPQVSVTSQILENEFCTGETGIICNVDVSLGIGGLGPDIPGAGSFPLERQQEVNPACKSSQSLQRLLQWMPRSSSPVERFAVQELQRFTKFLDTIPQTCGLEDGL
ncbi:unnamed protein product, partial [Cyprideis torosa]